MLDGLKASVIAAGTGALVLLLLFGYLALTYRMRCLRLWTGAWAAYTAQFVLILIALFHDRAPALVAATTSVAFLAGLLLAAGLLDFLGRGPGRMLYTVGAAGVAWCLGSAAAGWPLEVQVLPVTTFLALAFFGCGAVLLYVGRGVGARAAGVCLVLWAIHVADYALLGQVVWFAPWGYLLGGALSLLTALSLMLMYLDDMRRGLETSEARYRALFDNMVQGVFYQAADGRLTDCNQALLDIFGLTREQFLGRTSLDPAWRVVDETGRPLAGADHPSMAALRTGRKAADLVTGVYNPRRGGFVWCNVNAVPEFRPGEDTPFQVMVTVHDISRRRAAEAALRESEQRFEQVVAHAREWVWEVDAQGVFVYSSGAAQEIVGYTPEDLVGKMRFLDLFHPSQGEAERAAARCVFDAHEPFVGYEACCAHRNGREAWLGASGAPFFGADGALLGYRGLCADVTRRRLEEAARARRGRAIALNSRIANVFLTADDAALNDALLAVLQEVFESGFGLLCVVAESGNLVCLRGGGESDEGPVGADVAEDRVVFARDGWDGPWGEALRERRALVSNRRFELPGGRGTLTCALGVPIVYGERLVGAVLLGEKSAGYDDYDRELLESAAAQAAPVLSARLEAVVRRREQAALEEQLRQAQKMEAIGTLAGGIAHDFNNIIGAISGYAELLLEDLAEVAPDSRSHVEQILQGSERAAGLVGQILAFSRKARSERIPLLLGTLVKETAKMLRGGIPTTVRIEVAVSPDPCTVVADVTQLSQVVLNLCTNAWQAMAETGGELHIGVDPVNIALDATPLAAELAPGAYARLTVRDTGLGIAPDTLPHIFEPFYTTKPQGKGTGMGLSVVHGVVKGHGGTITVESLPGQGTTFSVYLPRTEAHVPKNAPQQKEELPGGSEHILVVDDEENMLFVTSRMLLSLGYQATTRPSGAAGVETFLSNPRDFDLIITDLTMPEVTGIDLAEQALAARPDIGLILCTGFGDRQGVARAREMGFQEVLIKPIRRKELAETVRRCLDERAGQREGG